MRWTALLIRHQMPNSVVLKRHQEEGPFHGEDYTVKLDLAKSGFQVHGAAEEGKLITGGMVEELTGHWAAAAACFVEISIRPFADKAASPKGAALASDHGLRC